MSTATMKRGGKSNGANRANRAKVATGNVEVLRWHAVKSEGFPDDETSVLLLVGGEVPEVLTGYRDAGKWRDFYHDTVTGVTAWAAWPTGPMAVDGMAEVKAEPSLDPGERIHFWKCYRDARWPGVTLDDENDLFFEWVDAGCPEWTGGRHD